MGRTFSKWFGYDLSFYLPSSTGIDAKIWVDGGGLGGVFGDDPPREWEPQLYVGDFTKAEDFADETKGFAVSLSDDPKVVFGTVTVSQEELEKIFRWVKLNLQAFLDHWNQKIDTFELNRRIEGNKV